MNHRMLNNNLKHLAISQGHEKGEKQKQKTSWWTAIWVGLSVPRRAGPLCPSDTTHSLLNPRTPSRGQRASQYPHPKDSQQQRHPETSSGLKALCALSWRPPHLSGLHSGWGRGGALQPEECSAQGARPSPPRSPCPPLPKPERVWGRLQPYTGQPQGVQGAGGVFGRCGPS